MCVRVDEARRDGAAGGGNLAVRAGRPEVAHRGDAIAGDADIGLETGGAAAVEHGGIANDEVAAQRHGGLLPGVLTQV